MAIKRYVSSQTATITNAYKPNMVNRATGSNTGKADTMEVFCIYGQALSSSTELSRFLVKFPITDIVSDRTAGNIPASGSVNFYLRLFNARHSFTVPRDFTLDILPVSRSWTEGHGMDLDTHLDVDAVNWVTASSGSSGIVGWTAAGGDYHASPAFTASFSKGIEDLTVDVSDVVEQWIAGTKSNYGFGLKLTSTIENALSSSYTKRFFARGTQYFFKRPIIEARWNSSIKDHRGSFVVSSSLLSATDNANTIYLYNFVRGQLKNIASPIGAGAIYVQLWDDRVSGSQLTSMVTGGCVSTGIYTASVALATTASYVYDRWFGSTTASVYYTGSIKVERFRAYDNNPNPKYVVSMPYLKQSYFVEENARFRIFVRERCWNPNVYTKVTADINGNIIEDVYYRIKRATDDLTVVDFGTGSVTTHTKLSYDVSGSYFDFDMSMLETGYSYVVDYAFYVNNAYHIQSEKFKFRVD